MSTEDQQDPVGSLLHRFRVSEAGIPPGCVIVGRFYEGSDASTRGRRGWLPCRPVAGTVVFDLGEVLVPSRGVLSVLARKLGIEPEALAAAYWRDRLDFDRGGSPYAYWSGVLAELSREPEPALIASLDNLDAAAWSTLPQGSAELLTHLGRAGIRLTLLSNAPLPLATAVRSAGWSNLFDTLVFSAEIRLVKPDPAIYAAADRTYGTRPGDVIFFDDRQVNVDAAIAHGWAAHVWTGPAAVLDLLGVR